MGVKAVQNNLEKIKILLINFFSLITRYILEIYKTEGGIAKLPNDDIKDYTYGQLGLRVRNFERVAFEYICFIDDYVKGFIKWFEFFSGLVYALGQKKFYRLLRRKIQIEDAINTSTIDITLLKFETKSVLNLSFLELEATFKSILDSSKNIFQTIVHLNSKMPQMFIEMVEKQVRGWLEIQEEVYTSLQSVLQEDDESRCVEILTMVINKCIDYYEKISETRELLNIPDGVWENLLADDLMQLFELFNKLKEDAIAFFEYRTKVFEHTAKCFLHILTMLWGNEEQARSKIGSLIKSEIPARDLIPESFSLQDLEFGLTLAVLEWNQAVLNARVIDKKKVAIKFVAKIIRSEGIQNLHSGIIKRLEIREKYRNEIYDRMIEIQDTIQKIRKK